MGRDQSASAAKTVEVAQIVARDSHRCHPTDRRKPSLRSLVLLAVLALLVNPTAAFGSDERSHCQWIWGPSPPPPQQGSNTGTSLQRLFELPSDAVSARLRMAACYAGVRLALDGRELAALEPYANLLDTDIDQRLSTGQHQLTITATPVAGPSAVFVHLDVTLSDGQQFTLVSDAQWKNPDGSPAVVLGAVKPGLIVPSSRRVGIDATDDYEQWKQAIDADKGADPGSFFTAPGFEIERLRSAAPDEDSWVSMVFDPDGRVLIGKEQRGLLRMTLDQQSRKVREVEHLAPSLEECRGLTFLDDVLYVNANTSKGLFRLTPDGDGFAEPELILASSGGGGHGRNDLVSGNDGLLYSIHGDAVHLPGSGNGDAPRVIDHTSPLREARRGQRTSEGALLRVDPGSAKVDLLVAGLRNPYGIDFNAHGEFFTYDADAEFDMGSPWYRPTRVHHLLPGADYGWRGVTGDWPPYYPDHPDNARPGLTIGKGSPTSVKFAADSNFPAPYRDALFILDWAYGRVLAVHMVPSGSSYLMTAETFLKGRPLNVTDLAFGPDGDLYLITGGRKTQSALYRVRYTKEQSDRGDETMEQSRFDHQRDSFAAQARQTRRMLESRLTRPSDKASLDLAWQHLSHADPWIRQAAARLLEQQSIEQWKTRALSETDPRTAIPALMSLARSRDDALRPAILQRLNALLPSVTSDTDRLAAYYTYWLCLHDADTLPVELRQQTVHALNPHYPSGSSPDAALDHNRWLSRVLLALDAPGAIAKTVELLRVAVSQSEQMHYLFVLRSAHGEWTLAQRNTYFAALNQSRGYLSGAGMPGFLEQIRKAAIQTLSKSEKEQLQDVIAASPAEPDLPADTAPRSIVQDWKLADFDLDSASESDAHQPNLQRGSEVFAQAQCIRCHRFGSRGTLLGPDLTSVNRRFHRADLLASILEPSRVIADNYRSLQIVTSDGRVLVGQATTAGDYRSPKLRLAVDPNDPAQLVEIPKAEIAQQKYADVSWMPEGLMDTFTREEILDLIAYLQAGPGVLPSTLP